jgi:acyl-CoA synthetase (AMP-forming)/AMP-acid ligase II
MSPLFPSNRVFCHIVTVDSGANRARAHLDRAQRVLSEPGGRVATMAMNSSRHLECWYGIMGIGAVCHTLNPRLFNADLEYIVARAADCIVIVDASLVAKLAQVLPACPSVRHVVVMDGIRPVTDDLRNDDSGIQIFAGHDQLRANRWRP